MDLTVLNDLDITADGSFHWVSGAGGVVEGRAVGGGSGDRRGKLTIRGQTAIFKGDDGSIQTYTFIKMPGETVSFSIGPNLFIRK